MEIDHNGTTGEKEPALEYHGVMCKLCYTYFWTSVEARINIGLLLVTYPNPDLCLVDSVWCIRQGDVINWLSRTDYL